MSSIASTYWGHFSRLRQSSSFNFQRRNGSSRRDSNRFELLLLADLQPELDDDHAFQDEAALELDDLVVGPHPLLARGELLDALDEYSAVPAAVEDAHPALPGDLRPEPPEEMVSLGTAVGLAVRVHREVARVESLDGAPNRTTLAARIDAFDDDQQAGPDLAAVGLAAEFESQREKALLRGLQPLLVFLATQSQCQIDLVESPHRPRP